MSMRSEHVDQMSIGEFARRSRLSAKALRLYDELGLLPPARVDEDSGYRFYEPGQLEQARLIAALRQLQVPLAEIKAILPLERVQAAERVRQLWAATEAGHASPPCARRIPDRRAERKEVRFVRGQHEGDARAQPAVREAQRRRGGLRITYLPSEVGQDTYQDFAVPFNGQPGG
jgi:DNA-binding transcriptional MerR regulator